MASFRKRTVERLEDRLIQALKDYFGPESEVAVVALEGVTGYWKIADVRRWNGTVIVDGKKYEVSSWSTMTRCARYGVSLVHHHDPGVLRPDWYGFDAEAKEPS